MAHLLADHVQQRGDAPQRVPWAWFRGLGIEGFRA